MADLTPEREAQIRTGLTERLEALDYTIGDLAARDLLAELDSIRTHDETTGVLYEVIRRALAGELDEHQAVRQIEARLLHPLTARLREVRAKTGVAGGRRRAIPIDVEQAREQRDDAVCALRDERERHGQEVDELRGLLAEVLVLRQSGAPHDPAWRALDPRIEHAVRSGEEEDR